MKKISDVVIDEILGFMVTAVPPIACVVLCLYLY